MVEGAFLHVGNMPCEHGVGWTYMGDTINQPSYNHPAAYCHWEDAHGSRIIIRCTRVFCNGVWRSIYEKHRALCGLKMFTPGVSGLSLYGE